MRFGKQRATLGLFFLLLPLVTTLAFLQTPYVSDLVLQLTLKMLRFRTGIKIDAESWSVRPITFSAALENIEVSLDTFKVKSPELKVQISPLSLAIGRLHIAKVSVLSAQVFGEVPSAWTKKSSSPRKNEIFFERDLPKVIGDSVNSLIKQARDRNISFEKFQLINLKSTLNGYELQNGTIEVENLEAGQARLDWDLKGLKIANQVSEVDASTLSLALIRNEKAEYFLVMPLFTIQPKGKRENLIQANGRWPGDMRLSAVVDLGDIIDWVNNSPLIGSSGIKKSSGQIGFDGNATLSRNNLEQLSGELKGSDINIDGYLIQGLDASFQGKQGRLVFDRLNLSLPLGTGDSPRWKNLLRTKNLVLDSNKLEGEVDFEEIGLCSILHATDIPDCLLSFPVTGPAKFTAKLDPFKMVLKSDFQIPELFVDNDSIRDRNNRSNQIVSLKPLKLLADVDIESKGMNFRPSRIVWEDGSQLVVDGNIQFDPTIVDLNIESRNSRFESMMKSFLDLSPLGKANLTAKVFYSELVPEEVGQTRVLGRFNVDDIGVESQNFGSITGPINYASRTLRIGPLRLTNGGGKATVDGTLQSTSRGGFLNIGMVSDRLELSGVTPETKNEIFRGFVSGTATLRGFVKPGTPESLAGPIDLRIDTFRAFGVPFQKGIVKARYRNENLDLLQVIGTKEKANVRMQGTLNPRGASELRFNSEDFKIRDLALDPNLDILQNGLVSIDGFWKPSQGWELNGKVSKVRIAGTDVPDGSLKLSGGEKDFNALAQLGDKLNFDMRTVGETPQQSRLEKFRVSAKDEIIYSAFAYLKTWVSPVPVTTRGEISVDMNSQNGEIILKNLEIKGPQGAGAEVVTLLKTTGSQVFSWSGSRVTQNTFQVKGASQLELSANTTGAAFDMQIPLALLDLVVPNLKFIDGKLNLRGQIPLPPDVASIQARGDIERGTLFIRGVGQPIENIRAQMLLNRQQLNFSGVRGDLGGGEVKVDGFYKIDLRKPAANLQIGLNRAHVVIMDDVPADITGDLTLKGEETPYLLAGRVLVTNATYSKEFKQELPIVAPNLKPLLKFGLDVEYGTGVNVKNSNADVNVLGRMIIGGNDLLPDISGKVSVVSGSLFANETEFKIIQGIVVFPGGEAMPQVNLQANASIKNNNQDYKIEMRAKGSADNLNIEFSSEPSLSNGDIVNLLAFGVIRPSSDSGVSGDLTGAARIEMLQALFGRAIGQSLDRSTGVQVRFKSAQGGVGKDYILKVQAVKKLSDRMTLTVGRNLDITAPENNVQVDYQVFNNMNITGVFQQGSENQDSSKGVDLRFRFEVK